MMPEVSFLAGVLLTMGASLIAVLHFRKPLLAILTDLCGTSPRAQFWASFSNASLMLVPLIVALRFDVDMHRTAPFAAMVSQLQGGAIGLVITLAVLGLAMHSGIEHFMAGAAARSNTVPR